MAALTLPLRSLHQKRRAPLRKNPALDFIEGIDSGWKGHEAFVFWLVQHVHPKTVVDLGFDRGLSTLAFAYRNRGHVFGIDWFEGENYSTKCFALDTAFRNISNALRFHYVKNVHLIVGPFKDVSRTWKRKIDILHIDGAPTYQIAKQHYENWTPYLQEGGIILIHDVTLFPKETGRFFEELSLPKVLFPQAQGLGVLCQNGALIEEIREKFHPCS